MLPHGKRWQYAFRTFFSLIFHGRIAGDILAEFAAPAAPVAPRARVEPVPPTPIEKPVETNDRAAQILAILQRDGRLVDFLMEDLAAYSNEQVGAAVRDVHRGCRQALEKYATLGPVFDAAEGSMVMVDAGTDAARVKIVGNAAGAPPFRGVLRHRGWDAARLDLPPLPATGRSVLAPAEVEIQ